MGPCQISQERSEQHGCAPSWSTCLSVQSCACVRQGAIHGAVEFEAAPQNYGPMDVEGMPSNAADEPLRWDIMEQAQGDSTAIASPRYVEVAAEPVLRLPSAVNDSRWLEWEVLLENVAKDEQGGLAALGAELLTHKSKPVVAEVSAGVLQRYNETMAIRSVRPGTVIDEVNGISAPCEELVKTLESSSYLRLCVKRQRSFTIALEKQGPLGLDCLRKSGIVRKVLPGGLVEKHNNCCEPGFEVLTGDCIFSVNSMVVDPSIFFEDMRRYEGTVTLTFHRP